MEEPILKDTSQSSNQMNHQIFSAKRPLNHSQVQPSSGYQAGISQQERYI